MGTRNQAEAIPEIGESSLCCDMKHMRYESLTSNKGDKDEMLQR